MYESMPEATSVHSIDLAREADFDLGTLHVRPATCEVDWGGTRQTLQRRVMQVLVALARANGSVVSQSELVMLCWRGLSVSDDAIVRCIGKLRKLASEFPEAPFAIETIPGVGYRLTSPAFVQHPPSVGPKLRRRFQFRALTAAVALAALIVVGAIVWIGQGTSHEPRPGPVTVEPFEALSGSADTRSLAQSIPNQIVNELGDSQVEAVLGAAKDASQNTSHGSGLVVTGILRDDGSDTNVAVRVEDGKTRAALWSTEFKRPKKQLSDLPLEVAARIVDVINMINFARGANPPLTDDSALSALLQTTDMIRGAQRDDWAQILEHAKAVVSRHPDFAFGHDVLAYAYVVAGENIDVPERAHAMNDAAKREAILTLKLDPEDAGAYALLAGLEPDYDYRAAEAILLRGMKTSTHPKEALGGLYSAESGLQQNVGRLREGLTTRLAARAVDPWGAPKTAQLAFTYANMGNLSAARALIEKGIQLWPNHSGMRAWRQFIAGFYEQPSDALRILDSLDALAAPDESTAIWRTFVKARAANSAPATSAAIVKIREAADQGKIRREFEIMMFAGLGATKQAMEAANSALDAQQPLQSWFLFTPVTRNMRLDPGFVPLASRLGLIRYWRETGKLPDICTNPAKRTECTPQLSAALKS